ncbi:MAG: nicotinate-nucleotide--dimethylbenzimidazole phosphoribosyltransferase [Methylovulum sp.]|uniref:nicotinate-nucleotide--dimethylbenzimidazole phosphoribosyltransferase n=1 Tax=Methylovulum sp. TaxID=1916980 RepID=UPI00262F9F42|nr:nicotinate-nucleotide--dimethylbenzimidazole phosphoribosyltransferase [Methylovulum sp.]MDD2725605.1 nicotinate-nucleotide--dimethylbenzimidazole phosphoribosyltransferase [Methylovulum sp.]MDD5125658.1 nicotinate-nucleotide--dimethylbenzimidazole phosphoribosyltransferase [Methylovulum sp.]
MQLEFTITPPPSTLATALQLKIDQKTKPPGALGQLETLALQIGLVQNSLTPTLDHPHIIVFAGDHGLVAAGVSAFPQSVTAQMVANFLAGGAAINVFARQHGITLLIADAGVNADLSAHTGLIHAKIAYGTQNCLEHPAMTAEECSAALQQGAELVNNCHATGCNCIGFGEMGIGNTASASLIVQRLTGMPLADCVGRGTGLDDAGLSHKTAVLQQVLDHHGESDLSPWEVLAHFGGFEIAMMTGAYLQAAELGMVIIVDGFIASAALLVASLCYPAVLDYCVFSHVSNERGHQALLNHFNANVLLTLDMRLGEGSGCAIAYPLLQSAVLFLNEMATFAEAGVDQ